MKTAIAFFVYNRLDTTQVVFERIREIKPPRLYLICDAARPAKEGMPRRWRLSGSSLTRMWTGTVRFTGTMQRRIWAARIVYPQA